MKTHTFICFCNALQAFFGGLAMLLFSQSAQAQVQNMIVHRTDGTKVMFNVEQVDSVTFEEIPRWANRSEEARKLLAYLDEGVGERMLSGVHASVNYNTQEADWVYKHTGKYPAINCIDFIHDIYSSSGGWINYANQTIWKNWTNKRGIMAAMWHWNMPTNDGKDYTCTPGTADGETSFSPSAIFDPTSEGYKTMIKRIDQVATWMKPMAAARVPILWRPLHEAQGNWSEQYPGTSWHKAWFWWGIDGPEAFVELWKVMYDRMVNYHGLTNLIWVYNSGDSMKWYPGDEYVDVVAFDFYNQSLAGMRQWYQFFQKNFPDKIYAISEFGNIPKISELWADGQYWSFMVPWWDNARTGDPNSEAFNSTDHNNANIDYWQDALKQDCIITRDELPNFR
jgi:mannan endo-1,4-beta-mannosidase